MLEEVIPSIVCREARILGRVELSDGCIIHPTALIDGGKGGIRFGMSNVVEERVNIINNKDRELIIGDHNWFKVGSFIENPLQVGNYNIFEIRSRIGEGSKIGNYCYISATATLPKNTLLEDSSGVSNIDNTLIITPLTTINKVSIDDHVKFLGNILYGSSMEQKKN
ncbi:hypothetical protein cand_019700 [Cryptosporidium andersoni]|uniref:Dynactin subunit 6 n=1 Tax=Cryptosporidium andersoni TaxID=117008 RepID=A0A1J4MW51_9CRYT|nr:hypothetical protein cand_019700 [Cryptosporidium andersoni]